MTMIFPKVYDLVEGSLDHFTPIGVISLEEAICS